MKNLFYLLLFLIFIAPKSYADDIFSSPIPIAEYRFDACSLASNVEDSQGNYNGIATGTDSTSSTSVLGGRSLDLTATDTSDWVTVPNSAISGLTDFSFSVWIKTGTSSQIQNIFQALGSSIHDDELQIYLNHSNTVKLKLRDSTKILSAHTTLTDNAWHHLVITRESNTVCLYVNGSQADCNSSASTGILSVIHDNSIVIGQEQDNLRNSPSLNSGFNSSQSFKGYIDELKIYDSVLSSTQIQTLYNNESSGDNTSTCSGGGGDTPATNFNCVENDANSVSGNLYTKTTAQSFSFDVIALQDTSNIETSFASGADHSVTVELVNAETVASCDSYPVLSPSVSQSLIMTSSDSGIKASASMSSSKAYSKVKCRVTDTTDSPSVIGCSTDSFSIRPTSFSSITSSMDNASSDLGTTARAGEDTFSITASTATVGYNGVPKYNSNLKDHNDAIQSNKLSGTFSAADINTGEATGSNFKYDEVGLLKFSVNDIYDDTFSNGSGDIDDGDCTDNFSNSVVDGKIGCKFANTDTLTIGRFIPHHFKITASTNGVFSDTCTGFTYTGQTFSYQTAPTLTVTAYNGLSTPTVTANYTGSSYAKLIATDFNVTAPTTDSNQMGADGSILVNLESWTPGTPTLADNGDGSLTFTFGADNFIYQHENNSKIAPFTSSVDLNFIAITDDDDIQAKLKKPDNKWYFLSSINPYSVQTSSSSMRFGRLTIKNTHGSELLPLDFQLTTEYYDGTNFIKNMADNCTSFTLANDFSISDPAELNCSLTTNTSPVTIGSTGQVKAVMTNTTVTNGETEITISDDVDVTKGPGVGNTGYVEITSNLLTNLPWLRFKWDKTGSAYDDCPSARATFGIFKGNSKQIYFREVY
jgi:hypothetical protein